MVGSVVKHYRDWPQTRRIASFVLLVSFDAASGSSPLRTWCILTSALFKRFCWACFFAAPNFALGLVPFFAGGARAMRTSLDLC